MTRQDDTAEWERLRDEAMRLCDEAMQLGQAIAELAEQHLPLDPPRPDRRARHLRVVKVLAPVAGIMTVAATVTTFTTVALRGHPGPPSRTPAPAVAGPAYQRPSPRVMVSPARGRSPSVPASRGPVAAGRGATGAARPLAPVSSAAAVVSPPVVPSPASTGTPGCAVWLLGICLRI